MEQADNESLIINITSKNRLLKLINLIRILIEKHKYKHFLVECDYGVKSIFEYIENYCYQFYNSKQLSDKLFHTYLSHNKYKFLIKDWVYGPYNKTIIGLIDSVEISTSSLKQLYYVKSDENVSMQIYNHYIPKWKPLSRIAVKTNNNVYFLQHRNKYYKYRDDDDFYDLLYIDYILNICDIEKKTNIPIEILQSVYSYISNYSLHII